MDLWKIIQELDSYSLDPGIGDLCVAASFALADQAAEIAELKAEVEFQKERCMNLLKSRDKLSSHINDLREALEVIATESHHELWQAGFAAKALSKTPAQSLAEFENEVIERCAKVCDELGSGEGWTAIASRKIRALKKEVE